MSQFGTFSHDMEDRWALDASEERVVKPVTPSDVLRGLKRMVEREAVSVPLAYAESNGTDASGMETGSVTGRRYLEYLQSAQVDDSAAS